MPKLKLDPFTVIRQNSSKIPLNQHFLCVHFQVAELIKSGVDVNEIDGHILAPLHLATGGDYDYTNYLDPLNCSPDITQVLLQVKHTLNKLKINRLKTKYQAKHLSSPFRKQSQCFT